MAAATIVRPDTVMPEPPAPDGLLLAFVRLCRQLERPVTEAELRSAAPIPDGGADLACLGRVAERLGFAVRTTRLTAAALARLPPPFLLLAREPGKAWVGPRADPGSGRPGRADPWRRHGLHDQGRGRLRRPADAAGPCRRQAARPMALGPAAPGTRRALADRPGVGGDQPDGAGDAAVHDDRLQQGHQPRGATDPRRAGDRDGDAGRLRAAAARVARLHHGAYRRAPGGCDRQRRAAPHPASALPLLRGDPRCRRARAPAAGRPTAPVPHGPPAAADRRSGVRRPVRRGAVLSSIRPSAS